jgi:hypothetical protein
MLMEWLLLFNQFYGGLYLCGYDLQYVEFIIETILNMVH